MKTISLKPLYRTIFFLMFSMLLGSCSEEWLTPKPLSIFTPENAFVDARGMYGVLTACDKSLRSEFYQLGDRSAIADEIIYSEVAVEGLSDQASCVQNIISKVTPTSSLNIDNCRIGWWWAEGYKRIRYANVVIARIDQTPFTNEAERNAVLGSAYFHRAYVYYHLVNQFGDVPFIGREIQDPKLDLYSTKREVILQKIKKDMEFAAQWCSDNVDRGRVTKGACGHLLTKINLALGEFDDAVESASAVIDGGVYSLMTQPFGSVPKEEGNFLSNLGVVRDDVVARLHWHANKAIAANKEVLLLALSREDLSDSYLRTFTMRICVPWWSRTAVNQIYTPDGKQGMSEGPNLEYDIVKTFGRGLSRVHGTRYSTKDIWDDPNDLRHKKYNWMEMEYLVYNHPNLKGKSPYYGKPLQLFDETGKVLTSDSINTWNGWPHYKVYNPDPKLPQARGGAYDWYVYRLAETYLLRAEAYWWKGDIVNAMADVNAIRTRAQCDPYTDPATFDLGTILDERARELFYEEHRKTELTRIAFIFAKTWISYNGKTYSLNDFGENSFYYDRIMEKGNFYNKNVVSQSGQYYTMAPYHVLWPVPQGSINANSLGVINQNYGYDGYENNVAPLDAIPPEEEEN